MERAANPVPANWWSGRFCWARFIQFMLPFIRPVVDQVVIQAQGPCLMERRIQRVQHLWMEMGVTRALRDAALTEGILRVLRSMVLLQLLRTPGLLHSGLLRMQIYMQRRPAPMPLRRETMLLRRATTLWGRVITRVRLAQIRQRPRKMQLLLAVHRLLAGRLRLLLAPVRPQAQLTPVQSGY